MFDFFLKEKNSIEKRTQPTSLVLMFINVELIKFFQINWKFIKHNREENIHQCRGFYS